MTDHHKDEILRLTATTTAQLRDAVAHNVDDRSKSAEAPVPLSEDVPIVQAEAVHINVADDDEERLPMILFIDDVPENIAHEICYFKNKGYSVITTTSTLSAMTLLEGGAKPDIIVSDMGRREDAVDEEVVYGYDQSAGLLLLGNIRNMGKTTPFIVYTTSNNVSRYKDDTLALGGNGLVCTPTELFEMVESLVPIIPTARAEIVL